MKQLVLVVLGALAAFPVFAKTKKAQSKPKPAVEEAPRPAFQATIRNGSMIEDFATNNPWMKEFAQSNLRDGLMLRLGQVLHAFPAPEQEVTWKGRLDNFVLQQVIKNKPMVLAYYKEAGLVSPFAVAFPDLGSAELSVFQTLLKYFANGNAETSTGASPERVGTYRFGYQIVGNCLAMSRDPKLAERLAEACKATATPSKDLQASVDWTQLAPPLRGFLKRYVQTSSIMQIEGSFDKSSFHLTHAEMPWKSTPRLGGASNISEALALLPSDTLFFSSLPLTSPASLSKAGVEAYLKDAQKKGAADFNAIVFSLVGGDGFKTGVLLSRAKIGKDLQPMSELLNDSSQSVSIKQLCGKDWVLLSNANEVYDRLAKLCDGKTASLQNLRAEVVSSLKAEAQHRVFLNLPAIGENLLRIGWQKEYGSRPMPDEMQKTTELLKKLPQFSVAGVRKGDVMSYEITQGDQ